MTPFYVASSKRRDRLVRLLNAHLCLGLEPDSPRMLAGLIPPNERKIEALRAIAARAARGGPAAPALHFVDDRFETLKAMAAELDLV